MCKTNACGNFVRCGKIMSTKVILPNSFCEDVHTWLQVGCQSFLILIHGCELGKGSAGISGGLVHIVDSSWSVIMTMRLEVMWTVSGHWTVTRAGQVMKDSLVQQILPVQDIFIFFWTKNS